MSEQPTPPGRPTWVEVDLRAFDRNLDALNAMLPAGGRLIAVLKADAYGHGAVELARRCTPERVAMIATSLLEEALELRRAGIAAPLLVLGPLTERQVAIAAEQGFAIGVPGPEELEAVVRVARERKVVAHLKIDSGMGRMGILESELGTLVSLVRSARHLEVEAIYSHLACASEPGHPLTADQLTRFRAVVETLRGAGVAAPLVHVANSGALLQGLAAPGELVRAGLALFGASPLDAGTPRLEPVMRWRTEIVRLKELPRGHAVGYGATFLTSRPSRIATLPVGYADGFNRLLSNRGEVLVRGLRAPVAGRVSMDLVTIDVTNIFEAAAGDEVVLLGRQAGDEVSVEEVAAKLGTISYEVFCGVSARIPRVYRDTGQSRIRSRFDP